MAGHNGQTERRTAIPPQAWDTLLRRLTEKEKQVIRLRFDAEGSPPPNITQVAKMLGLTRERVRQIEARFLSRLQKVPQQNKS